MLQNISIENFRCFQKAEFSNFNQINVLGGKNNAGKTALLEAIYLFCDNPYKNKNAIRELFTFRKLNLERFYSYTQDKAFDNLFFNQDDERDIVLAGKNDLNEVGYKVQMKKEGSHLQLYTYCLDNSNLFESTIHRIDLNYSSKDFLRKNSGGQNDYVFPTLTFIPTDYQLAAIDLVKSYENLEIEGRDNELLKAFQVIDKKIEKVRSFTHNPLILYIKRQNEKYLPISFYGDAMNKMAHYILHIIQAKDGILLIDEIENGVHHENQDEFWLALLRLAKAFNVQIFATSHSLEMISSFNRVASQAEFEGMSTYFEMFRNPETEEITANPMTMKMLKYEIQKHHTFRGE